MHFNLSRASAVFVCQAKKLPEPTSQRNKNQRCFLQCWPDISPIQEGHVRREGWGREALRTVLKSSSLAQGLSVNYWKRLLLSALHDVNSAVRTREGALRQRIRYLALSLRRRNCSYNKGSTQRTGEWSKVFRVNRHQPQRQCSLQGLGGFAQVRHRERGSWTYWDGAQDLCSGSDRASLNSLNTSLRG